MDAYEELERVHIPNISEYILAIAHKNEDSGEESIGTGVMIGFRGHHLVATAAHCIKNNPRVIHSENFGINDAGDFITSPIVNIIQTWSHSHLDIGFLQIKEPLGSEMSEDQLCSDQIKEGLRYIIGYPVCRIETNELLKEKIFVKSIFGSTVTDQTDNYIRLSYPENGVRFENGQWVEKPFFESPRGFSGGGCFGINVTDSCILQEIRYKLFGIQSSWHPSERWVEVIPIRHLLDEFKLRFGLPSEN